MSLDLPVYWSLCELSSSYRMCTHLRDAPALSNRSASAACTVDLHQGVHEHRHPNDSSYILHQLGHHWCPPLFGLEKKYEYLRTLKTLTTAEWTCLKTSPYYRDQHRNSKSSRCSEEMARTNDMALIWWLNKAAFWQTRANVSLTAQTTWLRTTILFCKNWE